MVGTGLIGSTFVDLLAKQRQTLLDHYSIELNLVGVANSKKMVLDPSGIPFDTMMDRLHQAEQISDLNAFVDQMQHLNLPNSVFVDCTAGDAAPAVYDRVLSASVSVITPNKKANSGPMEQYHRLRSLARRHNAQFLYETNVGAGLPIINTLRSMVTTGDRIHRIEGILSGTLSFLFNTYDGSVPFSKLLSDARDMGYTEPDPRDDLNGMDVARKLLILAREAGNILELEDLEVENLVPEAARSSVDVSSFFDRLKDFDQSFKERYDKARADGKVLRYIARFEDGKGKVSLQEVGIDHPFYILSATDNIVAFTSDHYSTRPMVVKGPGAGAYVTASGVIADVLRVAQSAR
jgi:aspartokinase/homoserine dehydrogenase 1